MNNKFKLFFFYFFPLFFLCLCFIPLYLIYQLSEIKNLMIVTITLLFLIISFSLCYQALYLSIDAKCKNKLILTIPLFILNIFYIPFYFTKYILNSNNYKIPVLITIINASLIISFGILIFNLNKPIVDLYYKVKSDDKLVTVNFPKTFNKCSYSDTYDLECYDEENNLTTMIVNYKKDEINYGNKLSEIVSSYADILKEKDETLEKISEPKLISINNKNIYQVVYKGTSEGIKYNFILSSIEYNNNDLLSLAIQVVEVGNYENNSKKLNNILKSILKRN